MKCELSVYKQKLNCSNLEFSKLGQTSEKYSSSEIIILEKCFKNTCVCERESLQRWTRMQGWEKPRDGESKLITSSNLI